MRLDKTLPLVCFLLSTTTAIQAQNAKTRDLSLGNTLYVVPYAHLDTQWRWAYPQVIRDYISDTLNSNFKLIDKYPNYIFNFSGSRRYEMMKEYYPAEYERLKGYIKAGRWFPCGSSVDEGDANVPSAEALVRHVLYGNRYFRNEFGIASEEFMLPDCFGFPYALPSILAHCGVKGFSTQKLTWGSSVGIPFKVGNWIGPDGRSVVAALDPGSYGADISEDLSVNTSWLARIQNTGKQSGAFVDYHYYGTGDIGGAPRESAVDWVEKSIAGKGPIKVVSSQADEMFRSLTPRQIAKLPNYKGELLLTQHSAGSITSQAYMKRWNRKSELLADAAEKASVAAMWLGGTPYPSERLYQAWDLVLGTQMHDMLPGTSIPKAYEFCWNDYLLAQNMFAGVETDAIGAITGDMDTQGPGHSLAVYNPLAIEREDIVEATVTGFGVGEVRVYGPDNFPVPTQVLKQSGADTQLIFLAKVPSASVSNFRVMAGGGANPSPLRATNNELENERFKVAVNAAGDIASIYDKQNSHEVLKAPARLDMVYHNPSAFPAWNMDWKDAKEPPREYVGGPAVIRVVENGPVRVALEVTRETKGSRFVQIIRLSTGAAGDRVEVLNKIDWQTKERALKASFPLTTGNKVATYDLQVGTIDRGNNDEKKYEVPQHQWLDLTKPDGSYGVSILNDSKFGSDKPDDDTVRLTLLYTPGIRGGYDDQATQDFGKHEILYAIAPHGGDWIDGDVPWKARRLNQPLRAFAVPAHTGPLGKSFSIVSSGNRQVEIQAVKKAEDSDEIIVRLREMFGETTKGARIKLSGAITSAREVDGQEREIGKANIVDGELVTDIDAYSLRSFAVQVRPPADIVRAGVSAPVKLDYDADVASSDKKLKDGAFDSAGRTYAAEQFPSALTIDGVDFKLGPTGDGMKNAVSAKGQTIQLPKGYSRIEILAASEGDADAMFRIGGVMDVRNDHNIKIQDWGGYVGQWDNRLWNADVGPDFDNYTEWRGLVPGWVKTAEVAWYASHRHHPEKGNEQYQYSYLYKYTLEMPEFPFYTLTLPNNPKIKIFAISVSRGTSDLVQPAAPLYDTLQDHQTRGGPTIEELTKDVDDVTLIALHPPLYWEKGNLRYALGDDELNDKSPLYTKPLKLYTPTKIRVEEFSSYGRGAQMVSFMVVNDRTAPTVVSAISANSLGFVRVRFSEDVRKDTAQSPAHYEVTGAKVVAAEPGVDGQSVLLTLDKPLPAGSPKLKVSGVADLAPKPNVSSGSEVTIEERGTVFTHAESANNTLGFDEPKLPVGEGAPFTLNFFCKTDKLPEPLTLIAGFGRDRDGRVGAGRYFAHFAKGLNFWVSNRDVLTTTQLDLGKWQMLTAAYDGQIVRLFKNGTQIAEQAVELAPDQARVSIIPLDAWQRKRKFPGEVRDFTVWNIDLPPAAIRKLWEAGKG